jgi:uncharacterized protein YjbI with pentapeptide repeats
MKYIILFLSSLTFFLTTNAVADCFNCNFDKENLAYFVFKDQNLSYASFKGAYLVNANGAIFAGALLDNSSFKKAELELANFKNASMQNTTFDGAYLIHAELSQKQILESKFCENIVADAMKFSGFC